MTQSNPKNTLSHQAQYSKRNICSQNQSPAEGAFLCARPRAQRAPREARRGRFPLRAFLRCRLPNAASAGDVPRRGRRSRYPGRSCVLREDGRATCAARAERGPQGDLPLAGLSAFQPLGNPVCCYSICFHCLQYINHSVWQGSFRFELSEAIRDRFPAHLDYLAQVRILPQLVVPRLRVPEADDMAMMVRLRPRNHSWHRV